MSRLHIEAVSSHESLHQVADEWNSLLSRSDMNSIFLSWEWISTWIRLNDNNLHILLIRDQQAQLVGIAPFYFSRMQFLFSLKYRCLRPIGDTESGAEYQMPFFLRGHEVEGMAALGKYLASTRSAWDFIYLTNLAAWTNSASTLQAVIAEMPLHAASRQIGFSQIPLPASVEVFWQQQSKANRSAVNRARRKLTGQTVAFTLCDCLEDLPNYVDTLLHLHKLRWQSVGESGAFERRPQFKKFLEAFLPVALEAGWLRFHVLKVDDTPRAVQLGFVYNGVYSVIQEGFDVVYQSGIGNVLRASVIEACIGEGVIEYDFLGGLSEHKRRWGAQARSGVDLMVWNNNPKNLVLRAGPFWPSGRFLQEL